MLQCCYVTNPPCIQPRNCSKFQQDCYIFLHTHTKQSYIYCFLATHVCPLGETTSNVYSLLLVHQLLTKISGPSPGRCFIAIYYCLEVLHQLVCLCFMSVIIWWLLTSRLSSYDRGLAVNSLKGNFLHEQNETDKINQQICKMVQCSEKNDNICEKQAGFWSLNLWALTCRTCCQSKVHNYRILPPSEQSIDLINQSWEDVWFAFLADTTRTTDLYLTLH